MTRKQKAMLIIGILFSCAGGLIVVIIVQLTDRQVATLPYPLLSLIIFGLLLICTFSVISSTFDKYSKRITELEKTLDTTTRELETTKVSQEERVERRTFELSVANAALNREIAERIQAETETARIKHHMELILESAGEGIFGIEAKGNVTFVNKAASLMLGWEPQELIGKSHHEMVHHTKANGEHYPVQECPISQAFQDGIVHYGSDEVFWAKDGSSFTVEYVSTPIMENGSLTGAVVVFRDISVRS